MNRLHQPPRIPLPFGPVEQVKMILIVVAIRTSFTQQVLFIDYRSSPRVPRYKERSANRHETAVEARAAALHQTLGHHEEQRYTTRLVPLLPI